MYISCIKYIFCIQYMLCTVLFLVQNTILCTCTVYILLGVNIPEYGKIPEIFWQLKVVDCSHGTVHVVLSPLTAVLLTKQLRTPIVTLVVASPIAVAAAVTEEQYDVDITAVQSTIVLPSLQMEGTIYCTVNMAQVSIIAILYIRTCTRSYTRTYQQCMDINRLRIKAYL